MNMYFIDKPNGRTFTTSQDCLTTPIRIYPIIPVIHLVSFTGVDLTARFSRKLLNGAKRGCVMKQKDLSEYFKCWQEELKKDRCT